MEILNNNKSRTRFAPSPTGRMHIGSVRSMLLTYIYAVKNNADFILRIDDTDKDRSTDVLDNHFSLNF
jgi:glutamyl-tRNA synthetase